MACRRKSAIIVVGVPNIPPWCRHSGKPAALCAGLTVSWGLLRQRLENGIVPAGMCRLAWVGVGFVYFVRYCCSSLQLFLAIILYLVGDLPNIITTAGGYHVLLHYTTVDTKYLYIILLKASPSQSITLAGLFQIRVQYMYKTHTQERVATTYTCINTAMK